MTLYLAFQLTYECCEGKEKKKSTFLGSNSAHLIKGNMTCWEIH